MQEKVEIRTIKAVAESKFKEKGSLFIGKAFPVCTAEEAEAFLETLRKQYYDATHCCYAYLLADLSGTFKYSDDGEPNGTAGIRIFNAIQHFGMENVLVASVRYFGGTKLGVGPLGKAYYNSAEMTLTAAEIIIKKRYKQASIIFDFQLSSTVHHLISKFNVKISNTIYGSNVEMICMIQLDEIQKLSDLLNSSTHSRVRLLICDDIFII